MTYNVQLSVIVRGSGLWGPQYEFVKVEGHQEVQYTPLGGTPTEPLYILGDNGIYRIYCNGYLIRTITIDGMAMPEQRYSRIEAYLSQTTGWAEDSPLHREYTSARCLNYPYKTEGSYKYMFVRIYGKSGEDLSPSDVEKINATVIVQTKSGSSVWIKVAPIDEGLPVVMTLEGVIVYVGNYEQQRRRRR